MVSSTDPLILQNTPGIVSKITAFAKQNKIITGIVVLIFIIIIARAFHGGGKHRRRKRGSYHRRQYYRKTRTTYDFL